LRVGAVDGVKLVLRDDFVPLVGSLRRFLMALSDLSAHISAADPNRMLTLAARLNRRLRN
jgi:hypothetical protein